VQGRALWICSVLLYRALANVLLPQISHVSFLSAGVPSMAGQTQNQSSVSRNGYNKEHIYVPILETDSQRFQSTALSALVHRFLIRSWLMVPGVVSRSHLGIVGYTLPDQLPRVADEVALVGDRYSRLELPCDSSRKRMQLGSP